MAEEDPGNQDDRSDSELGRQRRFEPDTGANVEAAGTSTLAMTSAVGAIPQALQASVDAAEPAASDLRHAWIVRLIQDEGRAILRLLWRLLGSEPDVMDAYQDCFCRLAARSGKQNLTSAKAYAYRTATNIAIEMIRIRRRRQAHWPAIVQQHAQAQTQTPDQAAKRADHQDGLEGTEGTEASDRLREAIAQLPPHLRNVIVLRDLSRLSYNEVGRTLGIEPATARVYRRHAVVKLADMLGEGEAL